MTVNVQNKSYDTNRDGSFSADELARMPESVRGGAGAGTSGSGAAGTAPTGGDTGTGTGGRNTGPPELGPVPAAAADRPDRALEQAVNLITARLSWKSSAAATGSRALLLLEPPLPACTPTPPDLSASIDDAGILPLCSWSDRG